MPPREKLEELRVHLFRDGRGVVVNESNGHSYDTTLTTCTCPDATRRGGTYFIDNERRRCKHMIAIAHHTPCPRCIGTMELSLDDGNFWCPECGWSVMMGLVGEERQEAKRRERRAA